MSHHYYRQLTQKDIESIWKDFNVKDNAELEDKLLADDKWFMARCPRCRSNINLLYCQYTQDGDPICDCGRS
jgi:hypothetical protein